MTVKIYQVGGSVRDQIMGRKSNDIDYAVEASSYDEMREFILEQSGSIFLETPQYVTIRAKLKGEACDFTLCRKESGYSDNRHPDIIEPGTILEDLSRRDATINAMALDVESQQLIDPYNGEQDICNKILRAVGDANERFKEDSLRILRMLRFAISLEFSIEESTFAAMKSNFSLIENISSDRIRNELLKMFKYDTKKSIALLMNFPIDLLFNDHTKIWLNPTMKE